MHIHTHTHSFTFLYGLLLHFGKVTLKDYYLWITMKTPIFRINRSFILWNAVSYIMCHKKFFFFLKTKCSIEYTYTHNFFSRLVGKRQRSRTVFIICKSHIHQNLNEIFWNFCLKEKRHAELAKHGVTSL